MIRTTTRALLGTLVCAAAALAAPQADPQTDSLETIQQEVNEARRAREISPAACLEWIERCQGLAAAAGDADARYEALSYTLTIATLAAKDGDVQAAATRSLDPLIEGYADDIDRIGALVDRLMRDDPSGALARIAARTKLPAIKALCVYAQAYPTISNSKYTDLPKEEREAVIARLKDAVSKYGDETDHRGRVFKELVAGDILQLERLQVGMVAPDIVGQDLDGVEFKLSDYRGKVVVIDFWGNW
jgi:hypothetical protein